MSGGIEHAAFEERLREMETQEYKDNYARVIEWNNLVTDVQDLVIKDLTVEQTVLLLGAKVRLPDFHAVSVEDLETMRLIYKVLDA